MGELGAMRAADLGGDEGGGSGAVRGRERMRWARAFVFGSGGGEPMRSGTY
jgi:hypothetical protein